MRIERAGRNSMKRLATAGVLLAAMGGVAVAGTGVPSEWQMNMQGQVTELGRGVRSFHDLLLWIITGICLLVGVLLAIVIVRFREDKNPVPARTTHNTLLEVAWTVAPVAILVAIAIPSFRLLREQLVIPQADVVVKTTGYSWYWGYEYPADQGGFKFDSNMVPESDLQPGQLRLLAVDNEMVVPVNKVVKVQVTSADVLHSFAVPAFAIKVDAVPGRLNETWFKADREGIYYGQCSELCGNGHPYMPIAVRVVSEQQYSAWLAEAKQKYAAVPAPTRVANAQ
ncbi:cytochrome c oxidase subunit II [Microvirga massiliensis]|uniref:cytochrome c oxidase subunit II n=1 Tax=Microvirga massiliensis TaxID=1033741 RepID=UPI00062BDB4A